MSGEYQKLDREKWVSSTPVLAGEGMLLRSQDLSSIVLLTSGAVVDPIISVSADL